jgi:hypothetical protein
MIGKLPKSHPEITKEEMFIGKQRTVIDIGGTKVGMITFLNPGLGSCLLSARSCRWKQASWWGQLCHHCSTKRMKEVFKVSCETTMTRIDDNQGSRSVLG